MSEGGDMKIHRVVPVLAAAALVIASCGGDDDDDGAAPTDAAGSQPSAVTTAAPAATSGDTTGAPASTSGDTTAETSGGGGGGGGLTMWERSGGNAPMVDALVAAWNEAEPDRQIDLTYIPTSRWSRSWPRPSPPAMCPT
jgi:ABC-type glycerol-3-phosphate transport system substrate-binding protein